MAEVGILIIFVLLLLIGLDRLFMRRSRENNEIATAVRGALGLPSSSRSEEIERLVRSLRDSADTPEGRSRLITAQTALEEMQRVRDEIIAKDGSETLAKEIERQTYRIANQEGQLQRYESQLKKAGLGKGERPCWVKPDGTIEYLYDVVLSSTGIRMRGYDYPHRRQERSTLPLPTTDPNETLSMDEFLRRTAPLYNTSVAQNCRFFVVVYDGTGETEKEIYKKELRTVEGHFYKRLDLGQPPF